MIIAVVIMFVVACITLLTIVNMICNCIIEAKKNNYTDEGNVYTVNFEKEEEKNER